METAAEVRDSVGDVVEDVKDKSFSTIQFATNMAAEKIEAVKHTADAAKDQTLGAFAAAKQKASNFGADVKNKIADTIWKIKDGAISIAGKVKGALTGGLNKILMIVGIALVALIVLFVVFSKMGMMPTP
ncbi:MAG: hypothetical protein HeimC2_23580 [Candidatus Heimdallarchaeota archaeon LC_2]|nr:MAG: hypothetical protein HeimC2_23580 [Candidatus Heimdallarchaeota archaeon LC_2]